MSQFGLFKATSTITYTRRLPLDHRLGATLLNPVPNKISRNALLTVGDTRMKFSVKHKRTHNSKRNLASASRGKQATRQKISAEFLATLRLYIDLSEKI